MPRSPLAQIVALALTACVGGMDTAHIDTGASDTGGTPSGDSTVDSGVLSSAAAKLLGEAEGDHAGLPVESAGDVDGDGRSDLLISAASSDGGAVYLVRGPVSGTYDLGSAEARMSGEHGETAGQAVANALDVNDDGSLDLIVGAPGETFVGWVGHAYLVLGPVVGDISLSSADATLVGEAPDDDAAYAVAGPGDVDGDGWDDLLVGAPSAQGTETESLAGDCAGDDIDEHDDEDGLEAGVTWLVLGPVSGALELSTAAARIVGEDGSDHAGGRLAQIGDLDGDGLADLYVGAGGNCEGALGAGAAYVISGPVSGAFSLADADIKLMGDAVTGAAGAALSSAGDADGDGTVDLLIGAYALLGDQGAAYLVTTPGSGTLSLADADATLMGEATGDKAGYAVSSAGDTDLDGLDDLLVGAPYEDTGGKTAGAAYLVRSPVSGTVDLGEADAKITATEASTGLGWSVAGVGDVDADGSPELLIGAPGDDEAADGAGAAWLFSGAAL